MSIDNTTPMMAKEYDKRINQVIPYYSEFYEQTFDVVEGLGFQHMEWLDLGCGTGTLEELCRKRFANVHFTLVDPSEQMLAMAKEKLGETSDFYLCTDSASIEYDNQFDVITAIQAHHYMKEEERARATANIYKALKPGGIYISFENVIPEDEECRKMELLRWAKYQIRHGKTQQEALEHNRRCGVNYFPLTVPKHLSLLRETGFQKVHVFWYSYMQMGIYGIK